MRDRDDVMIEITVRDEPPGIRPLLKLRYLIDRHQAAEMNAGPPPDAREPWIFTDWHKRRDRADALAKAIAESLAYKIIEMCDPNRRLPKGEAA